MKYTPVQPPEGINSSTEHPLKEFAILTSGVLAIVVILMVILIASTDFLVSYIPVKYEEDYFRDFELPFLDKTKAKVPSDKLEIETYLNNLVKKIQKSADQKYQGFQFTVHFEDNKIPNAFIFPGGQIVITTGLIQSINSENGLAMVLAHEMGHQFNRDPLRSLGHGIVIGIALLVFTGSDGNDWISHTATLGQLAFSRDQEDKADRMGIELLKMYYGHTSGATEFFLNIKETSDDESLITTFTSTHPSTEDRIEMLASNGITDGKKTPLPDYVSTFVSRIEEMND